MNSLEDFKLGTKLRTETLNTSKSSFNEASFFTAVATSILEHFAATFQVSSYQILDKSTFLVVSNGWWFGVVVVSPVWIVCFLYTWSHDGVMLMRWERRLVSQMEGFLNSKIQFDEMNFCLNKIKKIKG